MLERDTGDVLAEAAAAGRDDPDPAEVTDPADPSWVEPAEGVTPAAEPGEDAP